MLLELLVYAVALAALVLLGWLTDGLATTGRRHGRRKLTAAVARDDAAVRCTAPRGFAEAGGQQVSSGDSS